MRYFLEIAYKGTHYAGWQIQKNAHSVQAEIEKALSTLLRELVSITGSGRTDTGVHASQQFAHFDTQKNLQISFLKSCNAILPADISVLNIYEVSSEAHTRFDATQRTYHYRICTQKSPYLTDLAYVHYKKLNISLMQEAAQKLLTYVDFESFSRPKANTKHFRCSIFEAEWFEQPEIFSNNNLLIFKISANRFLWGMVRTIVGTLLEVGLGNINLEDFEQIIQARNRQKAARAVPAEGLFLVKVAYPFELKKVSF
jgi:tRNA pseudouridine38-40 synthase